MARARGVFPWCHPFCGSPGMPFWPSFPGGALLFGGLGCTFLHPLRLPPTLPTAACRGGGRATSLRFAICEPPSTQQPAREPNRLLLTTSPCLARKAGAEPKKGGLVPRYPLTSILLSPWWLPALSGALGVRLSGGTSVCPAAVSPVLPPCSERPFSPKWGVLVGSAPHTLCPFLPAAPAEPTGPPGTPAGSVAGNASVAPGERRRARDLLAPVFRWGEGSLGAAASHPAAGAGIGDSARVIHTPFPGISPRSRHAAAGRRPEPVRRSGGDRAGGCLGHGVRRRLGPGRRRRRVPAAAVRPGRARPRRRCLRPGQRTHPPG